MTYGNDYIFLFFFAIWLSSFVKFLFVFVHILIKSGLTVFSPLICGNSLYILDRQIDMANIFSHFHWYVLLNIANYNNYFQSSLISFVFVVSCIRFLALPIPRSWKYLPMLSSRGVPISPFSFRNVLHLELIYIYEVKQGHSPTPSCGELIAI